MNAQPIVSCLLVTTTARWPLARRCAVECFLRQEYEPRELVIVLDGDPQQAGTILSEISALELGPERVRFAYCGESGAPLGALRNHALELARGELVCQWDDDDLYHPARLTVQLRQLQALKADGICLSDHLHWFTEERSLAWVDWARPGVPYARAMFPGSLLAYRDLPGFRYEPLRHGEDTALLEDLCHRGAQIVPLAAFGFLYVYTFHGVNTYSRSHHEGVRCNSYARSVVENSRHWIESVFRACGSPLPDDYTLFDGGKL